MVWLVVVGVVLLVGVVVWGGFFRSWVSGRRVSWGWRDGFLMVYPNPGIQIGDFHWCKWRGRHAAPRPWKLGLGPGQLAEEGSELYERRMRYLRGEG